MKPLGTEGFTGEFYEIQKRNRNFLWTLYENREVNWYLVLLWYQNQRPESKIWNNIPYQYRWKKKP